MVLSGSVILLVRKPTALYVSDKSPMSTSSQHAKVRHAATYTMTDVAAAEVAHSNNVYILSKDHAWIPARVIESNETEAEVSIPHFKEEQAIQSDGASKGSDRQTIQLADYPNKALPLQNVDEKGVLNEVEDMVDLPFLHEVRTCIVRECLRPTNNYYYRSVHLIHDSNMHNVSPQAAILYNLKSRHVRGKPYTRTGDIVIAVNPYKVRTILVHNL